MSDDPAKRARWLEGVRQQHAENEGWRLQDTEVAIVGVGPDEGKKERTEVRFSYRNKYVSFNGY